MSKFKTLTPSQIGAIESEIRMMLHASRDCLRNQGKDSTRIRFEAFDGYYGEAFGVMRGLYALEYGEFGSDNVPNPIEPRWNLKWWFRQIEDYVIREENFEGSNECDHCLYRYGKDAVRKRVSRDGQDVILPLEVNPHGH